MIVHMMELVNQLSLCISRYSYLLLLFVFVNCNSKNSIENKRNTLIFKNSIVTKSYTNDSLEIIINGIPYKNSVTINLIDANLQDQKLMFTHSTADTTPFLKKKVSISNSNSILLSFRGFYVNDNIHKSYWHMLIVRKDIKKIEFDYKEGDIELRTSDEGIKYVESIRKSYSEIEVDFKNKKQNSSSCVKEIEKIFQKNRDTFQKNKDSIRFHYNELEFVNSLSMVNPKDERIFKYLKQLRKPLYCIALKNIVFNYLNYNEASIHNIDYNNQDISTEFKRLLVIELIKNIERQNENKNTAYYKNLQWLKQTDYYKNNQETIDKSLLPKDYSSVSKNLKLFALYDKSNNIVTIDKVVNENNVEYYLFDFWASWCAPCIKDLKLIHEMSLPNNLKIINISLDKTKDRDKWLAKTRDLNIKHSYLLVENESNKKFIHQINLNQIPRYILIDKYFNILDINMLSPFEGDFKNEIERLIEKNN